MGLEQRRPKWHDTAWKALGRWRPHKELVLGGKGREIVKGDGRTLLLITLHLFPSIISFDPYHNPRR